MGRMIKVGMADLAVCKPPDNLTTLGLGSCIGIALYDPSTKVTGLAQSCQISSCSGPVPSLVAAVGSIPSAC